LRLSWRLLELFLIGVIFPATGATPFDATGRIV
jgi:hypothetical protein